MGFVKGQCKVMCLTSSREGKTLIELIAYRYAETFQVFHKIKQNIKKDNKKLKDSSGKDGR